jgi:hypothetical protein
MKPESKHVKSHPTGWLFTNHSETILTLISENFAL